MAEVARPDVAKMPHLGDSRDQAAAMVGVSLPSVTVVNAVHEEGLVQEQEEEEMVEGNSGVGEGVAWGKVWQFCHTFANRVIERQRW